MVAVQYLAYSLGRFGLSTLVAVLDGTSAFLRLSGSAHRGEDSVLELPAREGARLKPRFSEVSMVSLP